MEKSSFADRLSALVSGEMVAAKRDPDRMAEVVERLSAALGFSVALMARGDAKAIDELMTGAEAYAHSEAVEKAPLATLF